MLELRYVLEHLDEVRAAMARRGEGASEGLGRLGELAARRSQMIQKVDRLRQEQNEANRAMAALDKKSAEFAERRDALRSIAQQVKTLQGDERELEVELERALLWLPNIPGDRAPTGAGSEDNVVVRTAGEPPALGFEAKDHVEVGLGLGILDFERAAKISGARFTVLTGQGARLVRALMSFMLDLHTREHGYCEVWPPALVLGTTLQGTGQLPKFGADLFRVVPGGASDEPPPEDMYLIPTAEVPLTGMRAGEIIDAAALPLKYCAYTPCFRSEAGSYGKDTRGMIRQHQFDKVELVRFEAPENGEAALEELTRDAERVLQRLGLHYRVVELCTGDLGQSARRCFDLEVWLPGQNAYREISSCSWFGDFQARRAKIRMRPAGGGKPRPLHTLNGSGLAIGRTLVAILEQYQQEDGSVRVPEALRSYVGAEVLEASR